MYDSSKENNTDGSIEYLESFWW